MDQISILRQMFNSLSKEEQTEFLKSLNFETLKNSILKNNPNPLSDRYNCPHCSSERIVKNGNVRGIQRFKCKDCGRTFSYTTNRSASSTTQRFVKLLE